MKRSVIIRTVISVIKYCVLIAGVVITLIPVVYTILSSFKDTWEIYSSASLLPKKWTLANYFNIWQNTNVFRAMVNSLILCATAIVGTLVTNTMTSYVLCRCNDLKLCRVLYKIYIASMFVSLPVVTMYPTYRLMVSLGFSKSLLGLMAIYSMGGVSNILLLRGNMAGLSREMDEAATIDGCSFWGIYTKIILPLSKGSLATIAILTFRGVWNDYLFPLVMTMGQNHLKTLQVAVLELRSSGMNATDLGISYAGASISIVPMVILFCMFSKHFTGNVTAGSIKG